MKENVKMNNIERISYLLLYILNDIVAAFLGIVIYCAITKNIPKAIDVYRDKATLEITYRDNVAIDSIVVYKK